MDTVVLTIASSSSTPIIGYRGVIRFPDGALASHSESDVPLFSGPQLTDFTGIVIVRNVEHDGRVFEIHDAWKLYAI